MNTWWLMFSIIVIISSLSVLWFFQMRRLMIRHMRLVIGLLERVLRPRDKTYTLLGYLVGFRAEYRLSSEKVPKAWALYMIPPHHVLLYVPVILVGRRKERLELTFRLSKPPGGEAHLYDPRDKAVKRLVENDVRNYKGRLYNREVVVKDRLFHALYSDEEALLHVRRVAESLVELVDLKRVTLASRFSAFHVSFVPRIGALEEALEKIIEHAYRLAR
ncbi:hypothetical protein PYJP_02460 [Pyrofollis japonicus]|uniref:hypothetical protein n=1 Tax=Pyrofollis japonicus TaxID=3060460 RepID=UPI00295C2E11|nr:hypothetical protein [Pyrofollis japonicus]BEP16894.1 hypothetical protein PYJP_02460 [Pyrofollis japonicus]